MDGREEGVGGGGGFWVEVVVLFIQICLLLSSSDLCLTADEGLSRT